MNIPRIIFTLLLGIASLRAAEPSAPLKVGDKIPDVTLRTEEGKEVKLRSLVAEKPTTLIFYRGGWCPFCTRHLKELNGIEKDIAAEGAQLLAISMDQPEKLKATPSHDQLGYKLLSDSEAAAIKAFGIAFRVEDATIEKYKTYKIDLEAASGEKHHLLPHPAVFVAGTNGVIRFAHVNTDYKVRLEPAKVLQAIKAAKN